MTISSKLVMTTATNKNIMEVGSVVEDALNHMLRQERKRTLGEDCRPWTQDENNSHSVRVDAHLHSESFTFVFTYKGESRRMWLHGKCDADNDYMTDKPNVYLSVSMWGNYEEILETCQKALAKKYPEKDFFFDLNDCDDEYVKVEHNT